MTLELGAFYLLAAALVVTAVAVITARDVVHAALFMIANFVLTAVLYLMLQAPFIAAVQVIVYAGAIMVLFLYVVMLLGGGAVDLNETIAGQRTAGLILLGFLGALLVAASRSGVPAGPAEPLRVEDLPALPGGFGSPQSIGAVLFSQHVLAFEIVSVLLLVGVVGAVVIALFRDSDVADAASRDADESGGAAR